MRQAIVSVAVGLAALLAVLGVGSWYGCSVYDASLLLPGADASKPDVVTAEAGEDAHDAGRDTGPSAPVCPELFPPSAPAMDDPSDAGDQSFIVAVHTIDVGLGDAGVAGLLGYDLDQIYTCCDGGAESCKTNVTGTSHCDDSEGRDNAGAHLFQSLSKLDSAQFNTTTIEQRLQSGAYSILMQVTHYNGQLDDTSVTAALYASTGVMSDAGARWDGTDSWTLNDKFVTDPDASPVLPTHFDTSAYVSGGMLVMHINFPISLGSSGASAVEIDLTAGLVTGRIVPMGNGTYAIADGQIAGRWNNSQLLGQLPTLSVMGNAICQGTSYYSLVKNLICNNSDIRTDPTTDKMGGLCDAISIGFGFTADPALMGNTASVSPQMSLCPANDSGPDDCTKP